jgi:hypothetical protein
LITKGSMPHPRLRRVGRVGVKHGRGEFLPAVKYITYPFDWSS